MIPFLDSRWQRTYSPDCIPTRCAVNESHRVSAVYFMVGGSWFSESDGCGLRSSGARDGFSGLKAGGLGRIPICLVDGFDGGGAGDARVIGGEERGGDVTDYDYFRSSVRRNNAEW